jgi:hypothetical protein
MPRFTTLQDAIEQDIIPTLDEYADDFSPEALEAIAREAYEYRVDRDEHGNEWLPSAGFELVVSSERFWEIVKAHDAGYASNS